MGIEKIPIAPTHKRSHNGVPTGRAAETSDPYAFDLVTCRRARKKGSERDLRTDEKLRAKGEAAFAGFGESKKERAKRAKKEEELA